MSKDQGFTVKNNRAPAGNQEGQQQSAQRSADQPKPEYTPFQRNDAYTSAADGVADRFLETHRKVNEGKEFADRTLLKLPSDALGLSPDYGFLTYVSYIESNVYFHLIVIETRKDPVMKNMRRDRRYNTETYDFIGTIDGVDENVVDRLTNWVRSAARGSGDYYFTDTTVVPAEVNLSDMLAIRSVCRSADEANITYSMTDEPFNGDFLKDRPGVVVRGNLGFGNFLGEKDALGLPVRADFKGAVREVVEKVAANPLMADSRGKVYTTITGFVNARWYGADQPERNEEPSLACYIPEVVITSNDTFHTVNYGNYERMFLGMSLLPHMRTSNRWMQQFQASGVNNPLKDVGGFGYGLDVKDPKYIDITPEEYADPRTFADFMSALFLMKQGVDFAYLIHEGGLGYTNQKLLLDIGDGNEDAINVAFTVLDGMTNGKFSRLWEKNDGRQIVADVIRMPTGVYMTANGYAPIEDIDTLAVLNVLKTNRPELIEDYFECTNPGDCRFDYYERMTKLVEIYQLITNNTFVQKGFASKVYLDPIFLATLYYAVQESELSMTVDFEGDVGFERSTRAGGQRYALVDDIARTRGNRFDARNRDNGGYRSSRRRRD